MPFRYIVVDELQVTPVSKRIEVFLEERAFETKNLVRLFSFLSSKHSDTKRLTIVVYTQWNQLSISTDCNEALHSAQETELEPTNVRQATFFRREDRKPYFRFNPDLKIYETVEMP